MTMHYIIRPYNNYLLPKNFMLNSKRLYITIECDKPLKLNIHTKLKPTCFSDLARIQIQK